MSGVFRATVVAAGLLAALTVCTAHAAEYEWRFALEEIEGSVQDHYAQRFAELVEKRTDGRVKIDVYPYGALGTSTQLTELVQTGAVEFAFASPGHLGSVVPEAQVLLLHYLFPADERVVHRVLSTSTALNDTLAKAYRERQLELLAVIPEGWMVWTADKPLRRPSDFEGLKIRTMVSPLLLKAYEAYGANPTAMPYSQVYSALQLNMIDAEVNPVFAIEEMSFYEQQSYMTFGYHLPFVTSLVTNPEFFSDLPEGLRETIRGVKRDLDDYIFDKQRELNRKRLQIIKDSGKTTVVRLDADERAAFRKVSLPVRDEFVKATGERGERILDTLLKEIDAARSEPGATDEAGED